MKSTVMIVVKATLEFYKGLGNCCSMDSSIDNRIPILPASIRRPSFTPHRRWFPGARRRAIRHD